MDFYPHPIKFSNVSQSKELSYDENLATNPHKWKQLQEFARAYYANPKWDYKVDPPKYQQMIEVAIKSQNILGIKILWEAVYYHDCDSPWYERALEIATKHGNLETFLYVLYGYNNFYAIDGTNPINYAELCKLARKNFDARVLLFMRGLETCLYLNPKGDKMLEPMCKSALEPEKKSTPEEIEEMRDFYQAMLTQLYADFKPNDTDGLEKSKASFDELAQKLINDKTEYQPDPDELEYWNRIRNFYEIVDEYVSRHNLKPLNKIEAN